MQAPRTQWEAMFIIRLFYRHTLGQIPRLIHIFPAQHGDVIGQQLQRNREQNRRQQRMDVRGIVNTASAIFPNSRSPSATNAITGARRALTSMRLLTVFSYNRSRGANTTTGMSLSISAIGLCFHFPGGIALSMDIGNFL